MYETGKLSSRISERNINLTHDEVTKLPSIMMDKNVSFEGSIAHDNLFIEEHEEDQFTEVVAFDNVKTRSLAATTKDLTVDDEHLA